MSNPSTTMDVDHRRDGPPTLTSRALAEGIFLHKVMKAFTPRRVRGRRGDTDSVELERLVEEARSEGFYTFEVNAALAGLAMVQELEDVVFATTEKMEDFEHIAHCAQKENEETKAAFLAYRNAMSKADHLTVAEREEHCRDKREIARVTAESKHWQTVAINAQKAAANNGPM